MSTNLPNLTTTFPTVTPKAPAPRYTLGGVHPNSSITPEHNSFTTRSFALAFAMIALLMVIGVVGGASSAHAQIPLADWSFGSGQATGGGGNGAEFVGDVNGDGFEDAIIGAYSYDVQGPVSLHTNAGKVWLFYGSASGLSTTPAWTFDGPTNNTNATAAMGSQGSIAGVGDINGDGIDDVIIGCDGYDVVGNQNEGCVFVFFGSTTGLATTPNQTLYGTQGTGGGSTRFGAAIVGRANFNNDIYADVVIAGYGYNPGTGSNTGAVWAFVGGPTGLNPVPYWTMIADQSSGSVGRGLAVVDVNNDGYTEILAGGQSYDPPGGDSNAGAVFLWTAGPTGVIGNQAGTLANAAWWAYGNAVNQNLGWSVAGVGDVNGDGFDDVAIGVYQWANGENREGAIMVWHGSALGLNGGVPGSPTNAAFIGESDGVDIYLGWCIAGVGDIDGDGYDDVMAGGYGHKGPLPTPVNFSGVAMVWRGGPNGVNGGLTGNPSNAYKIFYGPGGSRLGQAMQTSRGDVNGDGYDDILLGAYSAVGPLALATEGFAYLYYQGPPVVLELTQANVSVAEGAGTVTLTVSMSPVQPNQTVTVDFATSNGTAIAGSDYSAASGTLTFAPNITTQTIVVTILEDALNELAETFTVTLTNPVGTNTVLGTVTTTTVTITDNDPMPSLSLLVSTLGVPENSGTASLAVLLSAASGREVTLVATFTAGTAAVGVDFDGPSGTVTIPAGETMVIVTAQIYDNFTPNGDKTFSLALSALDGATPGAMLNLTVTILDDDTVPIAAPTFTSSQSASGNVGSALIHNVAVTAAPGATITASGLPSWLSLVGGVPPTGTGFQNTTGALVGYPPLGSEGTFTVAVVASNGVGLPVTQIITFTISSSLAGPMDVNGDGVIDVVDVQLTVNIILAATQPAYAGQGDANADSVIDVVDVQTVVNQILSGS